MDLLEFSSSSQSDVIRSVDISWLSYLDSKTNFDDYCNKYNISITGRSLFYEIDDEHFSGIINNNKTRAEDALEIINSIIEVYKSINFLKTYVVPPDEPLKDTRLFLQNNLFVHFPEEFYHGFTPEEYMKMKNITTTREKIYGFLAVDEFSKEGHKIHRGKKVKLVFKTKNKFIESKIKIQHVVDFLLEAAKNNHYVQLISS